MQGTYLALGELPEHGSQAVVVNVAVGFDGHVEDVDGLLPGTLQAKGEEYSPWGNNCQLNTSRTGSLNPALKQRCSRGNNLSGAARKTLRGILDQSQRPQTPNRSLLWTIQV